MTAKKKLYQLYPIHIDSKSLGDLDLTYQKFPPCTKEVTMEEIKEFFTPEGEELDEDWEDYVANQLDKLYLIPLNVYSVWLDPEVTEDNKRHSEVIAREGYIANCLTHSPYQIFWQNDRTKQK